MTSYYIQWIDNDTGRKQILLIPVILTDAELLYYFFFFKQKTAYEIGLGIPAEPLFRSYNWEGVNPDGYFLDKLEPIPSALPSFQKLFQVSATALSIP